jgi:hypothetical protein
VAVDDFIFVGSFDVVLHTLRVNVFDAVDFCFLAGFFMTGPGVVGVGTGAWFFLSKFRPEVLLDLSERFDVVWNVVWVVFFVFAVEKILFTEHVVVLFDWQHVTFGMEVVNWGHPDASCRGAESVVLDYL